MNIICILQARIGSKRVPKKVLKEINNKPMLYWVIERLKKSKYIDKIVVATSNNTLDDEIQNWIKSNSDVECFRGSENNVLKRYYECAKTFKADLIVRATGDNPLVEPLIIDKCILEFLTNIELDYCSPKLNPTFPAGLDVEVFSFKTLKKINSYKMSNYYREHVTSYILANLKDFNSKGFEYNLNLSEWRWTVDEEIDFNFMEKLFSSLPNIIELDFKKIIKYLNKNPDIVKINSGRFHDFKKI